MPPIYVDLDFTLSYHTYTNEARAEVDHFVFRPGALAFLQALSRHGELRLLTMSNGGWADLAFAERPDLRDLFSLAITMEDLEEVEQRLQAIFSLAGVSEEEKLDMVGMIKPISEPGIAFDDQAYGSGAWYLKSVAIGTFDLGPDLWVKVDPFTKSSPDLNGLERAFHRFKARNSRWTGRGAGPGTGGRNILGRKSLDAGPDPGYTSRVIEHLA